MIKKAAITLDRIPASYAAFSKNATRAKLLYMRSQHKHLQLVARDDIVPMLLRLMPLRRL